MAQQTINFDNVQRRPVRETDREFLLRVFASFKERDRDLAPAPVPDEMWDLFVASQFELQHNHYLDAWSEGGSFEVIELKGKPIGRIYLWRGLDRGVEQIRIVEFTLLTEYRNRGIGSHVMREVLAWADDVSLPVRTRLMPFELSRPFLERHGFSVFEAEETSLQFEDQADALVDIQLRAREQRYRAVYPNGSFELILLNDEPIGRFACDQTGDVWQIIDLALIPHCRGNLWGLRLVQNFLRCADAAGRRVCATVLASNIKARKLWLHVGFQVVEERLDYWSLLYSPETADR